MKTAYNYASHRLLELLIKDNDLMGQLTSVKRYLLMQQGDFISQYMDTIDDELSKPNAEMNANKMVNLLGLTLGLSSAKDDPYKDQLVNDPSDTDLVNEIGGIHSPSGHRRESTGETVLKGYECFCFNFVVNGPVSLVINRDSLQPYKLVFRIMFYLKHVERQLSRLWIHNKNAKRFEQQMNGAQR